MPLPGPGGFGYNSFNPCQKNKEEIKMKHLWTAVLCLLTALSLILPVQSPVQAFEANVSGQVNQLIMYTDNGADNNNSEFFIADNDNSSTRFRFTGMEEFERSKIGFRIEFEAQRNASDTLDIGQDDDGVFQFNDRWLEGYFDAFFGKISVGKGSGAADNTSETDLSGTAVAQYSSVNDTAADFTWTFKNGQKVNDTTGTPQAGTTDALSIGDTRSNFDGLSRNSRIRYDTPTWGGANLAGSVTNGGAYELALFYNRQFVGDQKMAMSIGYVDTQNRKILGTDIDFTQIGASISYLGPFGFNVTGAFGQRYFQNQEKEARESSNLPTDATNYYIKLGWKSGIHALSVEYGLTQNLADIADTESDSTNWGLAYVATPWKGVELFGAYRAYQLDLKDTDDPEDLMQVYAGTRIKF
jgi:hypothetical protein